MNVNAMVAETAGVLPPLNVELLSEEELQSIEGGFVWQPALILLAGSGGAAILGVAVGVAVYYFTM